MLIKVLKTQVKLMKRMSIDSNAIVPNTMPSSQIKTISSFVTSLLMFSLINGVISTLTTQKNAPNKARWKNRILAVLM